MRRDGERLRISASLVEARNGYQLWSESYDRRMDDVFDVQQEQYELTLALDPGFELACLWSGWSLEELGELDRAREMLDEAAARSGGSGISRASLARLHALRGEREEARHEICTIEGTWALAKGDEMVEVSAAKQTQDHDTIRRWVEERDARPTRVKGTGGGDDPGILRIDFPGYGGEEELEEISWDEFFSKFDQQKLSFLYQERTADGELSNFNKFIRPES